LAAGERVSEMTLCVKHRRWWWARPRVPQCYDVGLATRQKWKRSYLEPLRSLSCS
jgi:hypothetical protein